MIDNWPLSPAVMILSFPLVCGALMLLVHGTVQFAPRTIREFQVSYRPIRTYVADLVLILRLLLARKPAEAPKSLEASHGCFESMSDDADGFVTRTERGTQVPVAAR